MTSTGSLLVLRDVAPVRARVVENLRGAIVAQRFRPGDRLREKELCELTGTSRTSVREALRQLETEGLVEVLPNVGPVVATVSLQSARDIYEVRAALEALAGRLASVRASDAQIADLATSVEAFADAAGDVPGQLQIKERFYGTLLAAAGNAEITRMLVGLRARVTVLRTTTLSHPGRFEETVRELRLIIDALRKRDPEAAGEACRLHVTAALATAVGAMSD